MFTSSNRPVGIDHSVSLTSACHVFRSNDIDLQLTADTCICFVPVYHSGIPMGGFLIARLTFSCVNASRLVAAIVAYGRGDTQISTAGSVNESVGKDS